MEALHDQLIFCQRAYALNSLSAAIVHEFNNLMTPVLARAADALTRDDTDARRRALECAVTQIEQAIELSRRIIQLAQGKETRVEAVAVGRAVTNAVAAMVRPPARDGVQLRIEVADDLYAESDEVLLTQLCLNLLLELRSALPAASGTIVIAAHREQDRVRLSFRGHSTDRTAAERAATLADWSRRNGTAEWDWRQVGLNWSVSAFIAKRFGGSLDARFDEAARELEFGVGWRAATPAAVG